ncbi:NAD-dependent epimerase/dehydratase [Desulfosarcina variabilis str. Montpellier]|uniref:TIGR01777 family oxidoreductase n=1 Tax=Desulfosarcina variabilis TaxID=2300 RepID=UPI003AFB0B2A
MNISIAGASGFVGKALTRMLLEKGHTVTGLGTSRSHPLQSVPNFSWISADTTRPGAWQESIAAADAVVNLAGRTIFKRWTRAYKSQLVESRQLTTRHIVEAMTGSSQTLISTSAVGYYGNRGEETLIETSPPGEDFLARLSVDWEQEALAGESRGVRVAILRFGVVLGTGGGALAQMLPAFRAFAGGPIGSGRQWFAWIHMDDLLAAIVFLLENGKAHGPYNACSPGMVRQRDFASTLGSVLGRPALVPVPSLALRLLLGEMAGVLLASQRAKPERLIEDGFSFRFADVEHALADLVSRA